MATFQIYIYIYIYIERERERERERDMIFQLYSGDQFYWWRKP